MRSETLAQTESLTPLELPAFDPDAAEIEAFVRRPDAWRAVGASAPDPHEVASTIAASAAGGVFVVDGYEHLLVLDGLERGELPPPASDPERVSRP